MTAAEVKHGRVVLGQITSVGIVHVVTMTNWFSELEVSIPHADRFITWYNSHYILCNYDVISSEDVDV
jgi:hypothetical protein